MRVCIVEIMVTAEVIAALFSLSPFTLDIDVALLLTASSSAFALHRLARVFFRESALVLHLAI